MLSCDERPERRSKMEKQWEVLSLDLPPSQASPWGALQLDWFDFIDAGFALDDVVQTIHYVPESLESLAEVGQPGSLSLTDD